MIHPMPAKHVIVTLALIATLLSTLIAYSQSERIRMPAPASAPATKWIDAWGVSFLSTTVNGTVQNVPTFNNQTIRFNIFPNLSGTQARVKFTNKFSKEPIQIGGAHIAIRGRGNAIDPATDNQLTFNGIVSITLQPDEERWSDPVDLNVKQHEDVSVSVYIPGTVKPTGFHPTGLKTSYISAAGDHTGDASIPLGMPRQTDMVFFISDLQVQALATTKVIVTLGDSITDGSASANDANGSWPNVLSKRLPALPDGTPVSVINMGIGSNRFVSADAAGPAGVKRFADDVLARDNVAYLIVLEGINDISYENVPPEKLIDGYKEIIAKAHAKGIKVYGATLLPIQNSRKDTPQNIATQQAVNKWIRESGAFDAVLDFEKVVQDPENPLRIRRNLTGDFVHPNTEGYRLIGESIDLKLFQ